MNKIVFFGFFKMLKVLVSLFLDLAKQVKKRLLVLAFKIRHPGVIVVNGTKLLPGYYSQASQDLILSSLLFPLIERNPCFNYVVDVGANHPLIFSNSYYFEKYYGCRVLAIDPLPDKRDLWNRFRPNSIFEAVAVGLEEGNASLIIPSAHESCSTSHPLDMFSIVTTENSVRKFSNPGKAVSMHIAVFRLSTLLEKYNINNILFISIDVEGGEEEVVESIDFEKVTVACFVIENNRRAPFGARSLRRRLRAQGYEYYARIWGLDDVFVRRDMIN